MKTLLTFNLPDKPIEMGESHTFEDLESFLDERKDILKNPVVIPQDGYDKLTFIKGYDDEKNPIEGFALLFNVPDEFQN